ncbi:MAG: hypothetical protein IPF92_12975 [Myxococcales bacterium]|nr:hypothetical protein [Myxococcales bacterium]
MHNLPKPRVRGIEDLRSESDERGRTDAPIAYFPTDLPIPFWPSRSAVAESTRPSGVLAGKSVGS